MDRKLVLASLVLASLTANCSGASDAGSGNPAAGTPGQAGTAGGNAGAPPAAAGSVNAGSGTSGSAAAAGADLANGGAPSAGAASGNGGSAAGSDAGVSGSGGGSASGGGAGSAVTDAGSGGGTPTSCSNDLVFCDDFESYASMAQPSGKWKTTTVGQGTLVVDTLHAFSGTKAAHIHGTVSQHQNKEQAFMLAQSAPSFPVAGQTFFLRFMMYGTRFPFTGVTSANHIALAWVGSKAAMVNPDVGAPGQAYMLSDYNGVSIEPQWSGYYRDTTTHFKDATQANSWHCWEVEMSNTGGPPAGGATGVASFHIWEDGTELKLSEKGAGNYPAISFEALMFALYSPQTDTAPADFWIDDVAVSKTRVNCPAPK